MKGSRRQYIISEMVSNGRELMGNRRKSMVVILYLSLVLISLGILAFGIVMIKIAYDLRHPLEFISASLVILIGASLTLGFCLRAVQRLNEKK
jgi:TRAP-type C4-dicarboxylate transport system permease small subunit